MPICHIFLNSQRNVSLFQLLRKPHMELLPLVFFPISTHFIAPPEISSAPTVLQLGSFHRLSRVEPWDLTADLKSHIQTLYAQSFWIMQLSPKNNPTFQISLEQSLYPVGFGASSKRKKKIVYK